MKELNFSRLEVIDEKCNTEISELMKLSLGSDSFDVNKYILSDGSTTLEYTGILMFPSDSYNGLYVVIPQLDRSIQDECMIADIIQDRVGFLVNPRIEDLE